MKNEFMSFSFKRMLISMALAAVVSNPLFANVDGIQDTIKG